MTTHRLLYSLRLLALLGASLSPAMSLRAVAAEEPTALYRSARDFGANGADDRDDTAAIQQAIDTVGGKSGRGGVVFLPAGRYLLSRTLVITQPGVTLLGEGRGGATENSPGGTLLVLPAGGTNTAIELRGARFSGVRNLAVLRRGEDIKGQKPTDAAIRLEGTYHCFLRELALVSPISGVELCNGISPVVEDVSIKGPLGAYGFWLHGSGKGPEGYRKIDAAHFVRVSGGAGSGTAVEWMVLGPNVDGAKVQDGRFVAGSRGLVLRGGDPKAGDTRPKYIYTDKFGCDHVNHEGVLIEAGNDVFMNNTWIGQNKHASGVVIGPGFTGGALLTDMRIRGSGGHGLHIQGGRNIYIQNPLIGTNGTDRKIFPKGSTEAAGILIEKGVKNLRVTGGGVCPLYESGAGALQNYGVRYLGEDAQAVADSVRISGVDTTGNPVPFAPAGLSVDRM